LAWEILNVCAMYRMGFWWALYPFPCNVLAVYLLGTPALAPSVSNKSSGCVVHPAVNGLPTSSVTSTTDNQNVQTGSIPLHPITAHCHIPTSISLIIPQTPLFQNTFPVPDNPHLHRHLTTNHTRGMSNSPAQRKPTVGWKHSWTNLTMTSICQVHSTLTLSECSAPSQGRSSPTRNSR